jgi:hypothetical protein
VVLDFSGIGVLRAAAEGWQGRIRYASGPVRDDLGLEALLVRPDGVVAWAAEHVPDRDAFEEVAARWFGSPKW